MIKKVLLILFALSVLSTYSNAMCMSQLDGDKKGASIDIEYLGKYKITGYDICISCCGKTDGITASGEKAIVGITCAMNNIPFGTVLYIKGIGFRIVQDRGGMKNGVIDVLCNDHPECYSITGTYEVYIINNPEDFHIKTLEQKGGEN